MCEAGFAQFRERVDGNRVKDSGGQFLTLMILNLVKGKKILVRRG